MLLDALNRFGNFTSATQEFSEEQLGVIYELMDMVEQRHKVSGYDTSPNPHCLYKMLAFRFKRWETRIRNTLKKFK